MLFKNLTTSAPAALHSAVVAVAKSRGCSVNKFISETLASQPAVKTLLESREFLESVVDAQSNELRKRLTREVLGD